MKKIYTILFLAFFATAAHAQQDTAQCNARFFTEPNGSQVYFRAVDSITGVQHFWNFGDTSTLGYGNYVGVQHTYSHSGTFTVTHGVRNTATGCFDSSSQTITIDLDPPPPCGISVVAQRDTTDHHLYHFLGQTYLAGGQVDTISWSVNTGYAGMGDTLVRTFPAGAYTVCASLSTSLGCHAQGCITIIVTDSTPTPPDTGRVTPPDTGKVSPPDTSRVPPPTDSTGLGANTYITSYPNPAAASATVDLTLTQATPVYIRVYNSMGNPVSSMAVPGFKGTNHIQIPMGKLGSGIYYIQVQYGDVVKRSTIQKL